MKKKEAKLLEVGDRVCQPSRFDWDANAPVDRLYGTVVGCHPDAVTILWDQGVTAKYRFYDCKNIETVLSAEPPLTPSTMIDLAPIRDRVQKATPGPWIVEPSSRPTIHTAADTGSGYFGQNSLLGMWKYGAEWGQPFDNMDDADFIAHARDDVPALLAEVDRLQTLAKNQADQAKSLSDAFSRMESSRDALHAQVADLQAEVDRLTKQTTPLPGHVIIQIPLTALTAALDGAFDGTPATKRPRPARLEEISSIVGEP